MHFSSAGLFIQYYAPIVAGVIAGLICRTYFADKMQNKIKKYENNLRKTHEKIVELEAVNENLQMRLKEMENYFSRDKIIMN